MPWANECLRFFAPVITCHVPVCITSEQVITSMTALQKQQHRCCSTLIADYIYQLLHKMHEVYYQITSSNDAGRSIMRLTTACGLRCYWRWYEYNKMLHIKPYMWTRPTSHDTTAHIPVATNRICLCRWKRVYLFICQSSGYSPY